jgi:hypothetical protein
VQSLCHHGFVETLFNIALMLFVFHTICPGLATHALLDQGRSFEQPLFLQVHKEMHIQHATARPLQLT